MFDTWTIQVKGKVATSLNIGRLIVDDELYVSANTKLCDFSNSACVSSKQIAQQFCDALLPILRKRYGDLVCLTVVNRGTQGRPAYDDALVVARITQKMFAPNRPPKIQVKPANE